MKKEAIFSLPGDPGLPSDVTERDISQSGDGIESDPVSNQQGESEIEVDWMEFGSWFSEGGERLPEFLESRFDQSPAKLTYTYSYDYNYRGVGDIKPIQLYDYKTGKTLTMQTDKYIIESFADYYDDQIKADIIESEKNSERSSPPIDPREEYNPDDIF